MTNQIIKHHNKTGNDYEHEKPINNPIRKIQPNNNKKIQGKNHHKTPKIKNPHKPEINPQYNDPIIIQLPIAQ
jgi:hypothetical protein